MSGSCLLDAMQVIEQCSILLVTVPYTATYSTAYNWLPCIIQLEYLGMHQCVSPDGKWAALMFDTRASSAALQVRKGTARSWSMNRALPSALHVVLHRFNPCHMPVKTYAGCFRFAANDAVLCAIFGKPNSAFGSATSQTMLVEGALHA